ncbi:MAG TPA: hypothetical protein VN231_02640 [Allosphingosinicella sp.]|nr:hypothetical protein [Allosphingosinicella sp.]
MADEILILLVTCPARSGADYDAHSISVLEGLDQALLLSDFDPSRTVD